MLVDATNGNIPFLFLRGPEAERLLGYDDKTPVKVKMIEAEEDFYYHRAPQDIPENFFFALEGWMPYTDLMQVFDNELGLYLSSDYYVIPIPYRSEQEFGRVRREYEAVSRRAGLECSVTERWDLDSPLGVGFSQAEPVVSQRILEAGGASAGSPRRVRRPGPRSGAGHYEAGELTASFRSANQ